MENETTIYAIIGVAIILFFLGLICVLFFCFRDISSRHRKVLRATLGVFALLLSFPTVVTAYLVPWMIVAALAASTDRAEWVTRALIVSGIVIAAWWSLWWIILRAARRLEQPVHP